MTNSDKKSYPSEVEIKEFWEWCGGLEYSRLCGKTYELVMPDGGIVNCRVESVDLNNLLQYAVPKLIAEGWSIVVSRDKGYKTWDTELNHSIKQSILKRLPELKDSLFWAIWEVIK